MAGGGRAYATAGAFLVFALILAWKRMSWDLASWRGGMGSLSNPPGLVRVQPAGVIEGHLTIPVTVTVKN